MKTDTENTQVEKISDDWDVLEKHLQQLASQQKPNRLKILTEIFKSTIKLAQESPGTLNLKICSSVLKELRYSFKLFYPYRFTPKITMFGSARVPAETPLYEFAKDFAEQAVKRGYLIITGGGPGIMAAGNEGAQLESGFGLNIRLPVEQSANAFIDQKKMLIHYKYFFTRKLFLVKEAAAFTFFPGGLGTFDEAFEVLTLLQTGKTNLIPVVMLEPKGFGFWEPIMKLLRTVLLKKGFISETDFSLFTVSNSAEEALDYISAFYSNYHSMRLVKEKLVIRMKKGLSTKAIKKMNTEFSSLTRHGKIVATDPLPEEGNEPELLSLPRIVFPFEKNDYGTLRRLVDFINENA